MHDRMHDRMHDNLRFAQGNTASIVHLNAKSTY